MPPAPQTFEDVAGARCLVMLGDSVTTDHISPAGSIKPDSPAGGYLIEHGVERKDFNSYGSRRGNHEVMVRGTFANVRLRNLLVPGSGGNLDRAFVDVAVPDDDARGYSVPPTNPYYGRSDVLWEIWSFGLRNPWRWSFDNPVRAGTGAIVIADVGQNRWEEINYEPSGAGGRNYGWRLREGAHDNIVTLPPFSLPLRQPIWEYSHSDGRSITGGFVYRGRALGPQFVGRYFFADYVSSRVWSLRLTIDPLTREAVADNLIEHTGELGTAAHSPSSFGVDASDELYIVSHNGTIYRIGPPPGQTPAPDPSPSPAGPTPPPTNETDSGSNPRQGVGEPVGRAKPRVR